MVCDVFDEMLQASYRACCCCFTYRGILVLRCLFIPQGLNDLDKAVTHYREVLKVDSTNVEAIACIGTHHFYNDQPEIALRFYRYAFSTSDECVHAPP